MKLVRFKDTLEIFHVPKTDACRYPDRELIERKRRFNNIIKSMDILLRPIHVLKTKLLEGLNYISNELYYANLKSISYVKSEHEKTNKIECTDIYTSSEDEDDFSDDSSSCSDSDGFEIIFQF